VDNNYLDLGMSKSGFIYTLPNGRLSVSAIKDITTGLFSSLFPIYLMIFSFFYILFFCFFAYSLPIKLFHLCFDFTLSLITLCTYKPNL
jgi:hypothetical protein